MTYLKNTYTINYETGLSKAGTIIQNQIIQEYRHICRTYFKSAVWSVSSKLWLVLDHGYRLSSDSELQRLSTEEMTRLIKVFNYPNKPVFDGFILLTIELNLFLPVLSSY